VPRRPVHQLGNEGVEIGRLVGHEPRQHRLVHGGDAKGGEGAWVAHSEEHTGHGVYHPVEKLVRHLC